MSGLETATGIFFLEADRRPREEEGMEAGPSSLDDAFLMRGIQDGNHGSFAVLVHRHHRKFYRIAYRLVSDRGDAEDIVQTAFLKLWERPELWDQGKKTKFTTWFYRVVVNLSLDYKKKKRPLPLADEIDVVDGEPSQEERFDRKQRRALLEGFIQELPPRQQLALNLCFYEGLSNEEAAEIIGVKVKALQSLIMRSKRVLKEKLEATRIEDLEYDGC